MSIKTILATLILGSSTAVLASPMARDHRVEQRPVERGHGRVERPIVRERFERPNLREQRFERRNVREQRFERPVVRDHRWERPIVREQRFERPIVREHRSERWWRPAVRERYYYNNTYYTQPYVYEQPIYTAPYTPFLNGVMSISLGGVAGNAIELSANGGAAYVQQVLISYSDGRTQLVEVGQELDATNPAIDLGTDGSPVASVTIYGSGGAVSAYAI